MLAKAAPWEGVSLEVGKDGAALAKREIGESKRREGKRVTKTARERKTGGGERKRERVRFVPLFEP